MTADNLQQKVKSSQSLFLGGNSSVEEKEAEVKQDEQAIEEQPFLSLPVKSWTLPTVNFSPYQQGTNIYKENYSTTSINYPTARQCALFSWCIQKF